MKAMGNFVVDFSWANGQCKSARIVSNAGAELRVRCKIGAMAIENASIKVNGAEVGVTVDEHGIVTIPCAKDDVVEIDFTTETAIAPVVVETAKANGNMYDVSGRRITNATVGQVYIQNGVKKIGK
jgi:hypothetical protein